MSDGLVSDRCRRDKVLGYMEAAVQPLLELGGKVNYGRLAALHYRLRDR